jgi:hypothetical protein
MRRRSVLAFCLVAVFATGCPASLDDPSRFFGTSGGGGDVCSDIPNDLFIPTCAGSGCHNPTDMMQGLDLRSPNVLARLVGVRATGGAGLLIDPAQPELSVLYTKLTFDPPYGARMPFGKEPLDDVTIGCVLSWIQANVPESGVPPLPDDAAAPSDAQSSPDDSSTDDAAPTPIEAGKPAGAGRPDAGRPDAGRADAGRPDAGRPDAGAADASVPTPDASVDDASALDGD